MPDEIKVEEDLVIGGDEPTGAEVEYYEDIIDLHAEIYSAANALQSIDGMDEAMLSKDKSRMLRVIRRKSLEIIHQNISDIHAEVFGRKENPESDEDD